VHTPQLGLVHYSS